MGWLFRASRTNKNLKTLDDDPAHAWREAVVGKDVPNGAVCAGRDNDGWVFVARSKAGDLGKLLVSVGKVRKFSFPKGACETAEVLTVEEGWIASWVSVAKGQTQPDGVVPVGEDTHGQTFVVRSGPGQCSAALLKGKFEGEALVLEAAPESDQFCTNVPWSSPSTLIAYHEMDEVKRQDFQTAWLNRKLLMKGGEVHEAAGLDNVALLRALLAEPVDVNERSSKSETALHHAACLGSLSAVALLLASGWDPRAKTNDSKTPLDYVAYHHPRDHYEEAVGDEEALEALEQNRCAGVLLLLLYGASPEISWTKEGPTPTVQAVLESWDRLALLIQPEDSFERREVTILRRWDDFFKAVATAGRGHPGGAHLGPACLLLRLVLETTLPWELGFKTGVAPELATAPLMGIYLPDRLVGGRPSYIHEDGTYRAYWRGPPGEGRWEILEGEEGEALLSSALDDVPFVAASWSGLVAEGAVEHFRTYSSSSFLPRLAPREHGSDDIPFIGLLNPRSGGKFGGVILEEAQRFPVYRPRLFDIVHVATKPRVMAAFRRQLVKVVQELKQKESPGQSRPRLLCGGGDGTASFAIFCIFKALRDEPGGVRWTDEELSQFFPAFVQLPLGTGNDFAGVLGWGRTINLGDKPRTAAWFREAVSSKRPVRPFDVWGLLPTTEMKVGLMGESSKDRPDRPVFKEAGSAVPFLCLLYFSIGFDAYITAQVEMNRTESRMGNFLEYATQISTGLLGSSKKHINLTGIKVDACSEDDGKQQYFPPQHRPGKGSDYQTLGFLNVNSFAGGNLRAQESALFDDGQLDLFRQKDFIGNAMRRGMQYKTLKQKEAVFKIPSSLLGVHCQYDGEARFAFQPQGEDFELDVKRVMQIPVAIGPDTSEPIFGSCLGWREYIDRDAGKGDAAFIPATDLDECKALCIKHNFGGFCVHDGRAHFRADSGVDLSAKLSNKKGGILYVRDESESGVHFRFTGTPTDVETFRKRIQEWVAGNLVAELNADAAEVSSLQERSDKYFKVCKDSCPCTSCGAVADSRTCKNCYQPFCKRCLDRHTIRSAVVQWMYADAGLVTSLALQSWSGKSCIDGVIATLEALDTERPIRVWIRGKAKSNRDEVMPSKSEAVAYLKDVREQMTGSTDSMGGLSSIGTSTFNPSAPNETSFDMDEMPEEAGEDDVAIDAPEEPVFTAETP